MTDNREQELAEQRRLIETSSNQAEHAGAVADYEKLQRESQLKMSKTNTIIIDIWQRSLDVSIHSDAIGPDAEDPVVGSIELTADDSKRGAHGYLRLCPQTALAFADAIYKAVNADAKSESPDC